MVDEFDWTDLDVVIVPRQDAVAVYCNMDKDIVIRRQRDWNEEDDPFVVINRKNAENVAYAILRLLERGRSQAGNEDVRGEVDA